MGVMYPTCTTKIGHHLALEKGTPVGRVAAVDTDKRCKVVAVARLGALHNRYDLAAWAPGLARFIGPDGKRWRSVPADCLRSVQCRFESPFVSQPQLEAFGRPTSDAKANNI